MSNVIDPEHWLLGRIGPMKLRLCGLIANMGEGVSDAELALRCQSMPNFHQSLQSALPIDHLFHQDHSAESETLPELAADSLK